MEDFNMEDLFGFMDEMYAAARFVRSIESEDELVQLIVAAFHEIARRNDSEIESQLESFRNTLCHDKVVWEAVAMVSENIDSGREG